MNVAASTSFFWWQAHKSKYFLEGPFFLYVWTYWWTAQGLFYLYCCGETVVITVSTKLYSHQHLSTSVFLSIFWAVALNNPFNWTKMWTKHTIGTVTTFHFRCCIVMQSKQKHITITTLGEASSQNGLVLCAQSIWSIILPWYGNMKVLWGHQRTCWCDD